LWMSPPLKKTRRHYWCTAKLQRKPERQKGLGGDA
jgi:hypothetical protein